MLRQPDSSRISAEQLAAEIRAIVASVFTIEDEARKCIEDDEKTDPAIEMNNDQLKTLAELHCTLLREYYDFYLATHGPSANPGARTLFAKFQLPARICRYGILDFVELLKRRLPDSRDHMLTFICQAYQTMALFYETAPAYEITWIQCLGFLSYSRSTIAGDVQD